MSLFESHWLILVKLNLSREPETGNNVHMVISHISHTGGGGGVVRGGG